MYHVSAQGVNERMINVHYYYYKDLPQRDSMVKITQPTLYPMCPKTYVKVFNEQYQTELIFFVRLDKMILRTLLGGSILILSSLIQR